MAVEINIDKNKLPNHIGIIMDGNGRWAQKKRKPRIFASGTGNPYFSTDTTAALRAAEIDAEVILSAKSIDAVYDSDPNINPNAKKLVKLTYIEVLNRGLKIMDSTAISLCMDNNIPVIVFGLNEPENIVKVLCGENIGTIVRED